MDPNATLKRIRDLMSWKQSQTERLSQQTAIEYADEMTELVEALDGWLSKGGFLPEAWLNALPTAMRLNR